MADKKYYYSPGRRKSATATVRLQTGTGKISINEQDSAVYLSDSKNLLDRLQEPFRAIEVEGKYDVSAHVSGGGQTGQVEAIKLGIAKALAVMDESLKATLKKADLLGRDPREKERKKPGLKGARKQRQFTKR
jgi:small subunit ribosomal protein S9